MRLILFSKYFAGAIIVLIGLALCPIIIGIPIVWYGSQIFVKATKEAYTYHAPVFRNIPDEIDEYDEPPIPWKLD